MTEDKRCPCKVSHDVTFCSGLRCQKTVTCFRFCPNHKFKENEHISMAQFSDHNGECNEYYPLSDLTKNGMDPE